MDNKTLLDYLREELKRLQEDVTVAARKIADLEARREESNRFLERLLTIATFVLVLWKSFH